ncbi:MAG TPA: replication-relaxation family protein [Solirubrobacteraceae bacterium]|jgi:hypothetical protein
MPYLSAAALRELEAKLGGRDWQVIERVSGLHFASANQLARLCFDGDRRAARRSLLRLTRLLVLDRLPRRVGGVGFGSADFAYHLGRAGLRLAILRGWQPERRRRRSVVPGTLFLRHTLLIAELHAQLVEADRSQSIELLELESEPACWRAYSGGHGQRQTLKPDSYARLGAGEYEDSFFVEIDNGTEGSRTIARQLARYLHYYRSGTEQRERGVFPKTLWLAVRPERVRAIGDCVQALPGAGRELFAAARFEDAVAVMSGQDRASPDFTQMI